jgi:hypothetical protein
MTVNGSFEMADPVHESLFEVCALRTKKPISRAVPTPSDIAFSEPGMCDGWPEHELMKDKISLASLRQMYYSKIN